MCYSPCYTSCCNYNPCCHHHHGCLCYGAYYDYCCCRWEYVYCYCECGPQTIPGYCWAYVPSRCCYAWVYVYRCFYTGEGATGAPAAPGTPSAQGMPAAPDSRMKAEVGSIGVDNAVVQFTAPAGASVTINGSPLGQTDEQRRFVFHNISRNQTSQWLISVAMQENGVKRSFDRTVTLNGGEESRVDLAAATSTPAKTIASK
jgi:uncharacterized protein (TIGR03000 family)